MAEPKTKATGASVDAFIDAVEHAGRREDARAVSAMLSEVTGKPAEMWGPSIVGFGRYDAVDPKGKATPWPMIAFSPRKANLVLYFDGLKEKPELLGRLGKHKTSAACLYLNRLADVDQAVLRDLAVHAVAYMRERYNTY